MKFKVDLPRISSRDSGRIAVSRTTLPNRMAHIYRPVHPKARLSTAEVILNVMFRDEKKKKLRQKPKKKECDIASPRNF